MTDQQKGLLITTLAALAITPDSLFVRLITADTATVVFWRTCLTGLVLLLVSLLYKGAKAQFAQWRAMNLYHLFYALGLMSSAIFFVLAIRHTSVANTVFILAAMPIFAAAFSWLWMGERIGPRMLVTMIVVLFGVGVIAFGSQESAHTSLFGDFLALLTTISFAMAMTIARRAKTMDMSPVIPWAFLAAAVLFLPFAQPFSLSGWDPLYAFLHGGFFIPIAMALFAIGPRYITAAEVSLLILLETVLAPIIAWAILGEHPGKWALIGGAIVLVTLIISNVIALLRK